MTAYTWVGDVVRMCVESGAHSATKYWNPKYRVTATRRRYRAWMARKTPSALRHYSNKLVEVVVTMGRPNHNQRAFVKLCKKAGEKFPVRRIQLKF